MRDDGEPVAVSAEGTRHECGAVDEGVRHDGDGGRADPLSGDSVVQTARRAAASIADPGHHSVPVLDLVDDVGVGRRAIV
jgi:hypothetical protein